MKIVVPPPLEPNPFQKVASDSPDQLLGYLDFHTPLDKKGRYQPFDELRHRVPQGLDAAVAWSFVRNARNQQQSYLISLGEPENHCSFMLTPSIQKAISETDRNTTSAYLEWIGSKIDEKTQLKYLLSDLIEDESISSSQLEGAATTTRVAKEMLKRNRKPRDASEKMILGNYRMMQFAWEKRHEPLSIDLILDLHKIGVEGIDDDEYKPGVFRRAADNVHVVDPEGEIVHTPPPANNLKNRMRDIVSWVNYDHENADEKSYLHPLIKAIVLHFCIGYEHPFRDGNGRVARALFYWYLFKSDFSAFRFIAISVLLKKAPIQYGKSYLYSETDQMDLTYFIEYQSKIVVRAIEKFKKAYKDAALEIERFNRWLWDSGLYKKLNDKQRTVFQVAKSGDVQEFTIRNVEHNLGCSYNTAAAVLNGLVKQKLFYREKNGREWVYFMKGKDKIIESWRK
ncbi:Fic family protein [Microbulbifer sp. SH-1]|uniref:Fic family protein n=1 Tax=Microbulbifer sp. SH-1 TaxID=2681547 RepID=UPI00140B6645|nr:Fic family protein [Microbulbifer sp. SH-1]QIL90061.1 Fic family protein [Microbulbifer sp. SH-1]